mmetsp:Transcript_98133/g.194315  ORF Transcript_98133/g.194315 Transcript_98133/m.194315 type:complete len:118 (+) Transcript_98133:260-613(+)
MKLLAIARKLGFTIAVTVCVVVAMKSNVNKICSGKVAQRLQMVTFCTLASFTCGSGTPQGIRVLHQSPVLLSEPPNHRRILMRGNSTEFKGHATLHLTMAKFCRHSLQLSDVNMQAT